MPPYAMRNLPGYDPDIAASRAEARKIMEKLGYGPNNRLKVTVATRNIAPYRDPAVILISQLKEIYIDADLKPIDTAQWYPTLTRKDFKIAMNVTETAVDDPDVAFYENYACGSQRNYTAYCNPEVDKLIDQQSAESNIEKRKKIVWEIEKKLIEDDARPILFYTKAANCRVPQRQEADDAGQQHLQLSGASRISGSTGRPAAAGRRQIAASTPTRWPGLRPAIVVSEAEAVASGRA